MAPVVLIYETLMDHNTPFGRDSPPDFIFDLEYFQKNQIFPQQIFLQNSLLILHGLLIARPDQLFVELNTSRLIIWRNCFLENIVLKLQKITNLTLQGKEKQLCRL